MTALLPLTLPTPTMNHADLLAAETHALERAGRTPRGPLKLLLLEDSEFDARLVVQRLR